MDTETHATDAATAPRKLLLIDGLNILRRCFEANPTPDIEGKVKGAMQSAFGTFRRVLREHAPQYALAAFDHGGPTFRHRIYSQYRASRTPMPQSLRDAIPTFCDALLKNLGLASVTIPDVEADDVIGTMVHAWRKRGGTEVDVISTDKDLLQLIPLGASIFDPFKSEARDAAYVQARFGVAPERVIDFLSLVGDASDDVPGVAGIGAKTAAKLVNEIGDVCALLDASTHMQGPVGEKLRAGLDSLVMSRMLIGLRTDVAIGVTWRQMQIHPQMAAAA